MFGRYDGNCSLRLKTVCCLLVIGCCEFIVDWNLLIYQEVELNTWPGSQAHPSEMFLFDNPGDHPDDLK